MREITAEDMKKVEKIIFHSLRRPLEAPLALRSQVVIGQGRVPLPVEKPAIAIISLDILAKIYLPRGHALLGLLVGERAGWGKLQVI